MTSTTDAKAAKENRLRLFREESERAMKEAGERAIAVRKNTARLRELRLAKEAETASTAEVAATTGPAKLAKRRTKRRIQ